MIYFCLDAVSGPKKKNNKKPLKINKKQKPGKKNKNP
jgi:hypothetical protein